MTVRRIVASTNSIVGELADLKVGTVVPAGEKISAIIPPGDVKMVARFTPAATLGRIRAGQRARLRLEGFPWTQYRTISTTVANVANEVRDDLVRVELKAAHDDRLHLQ